MIAPSRGTDQHECRPIIGPSHTSAQRRRIREELRRMHELAPRSDHPPIGDGTVGQGEDATWIVVGVQSRDPSTGTMPHRERQFGAVAPLVHTWHDFGRSDIALADSEHRVGDDALLGVELRGVLDVLDLTPAASLARVVRARGLYADRRRPQNRAQGSTSEMTLAGDASCYHVARRRAWNEHDEPLIACHTIAASGNGVDRKTDSARH